MPITAVAMWDQNPPEKKKIQEKFVAFHKEDSHEEFSYFLRKYSQNGFSNSYKRVL